MIYLGFILIPICFTIYNCIYNPIRCQNIVTNIGYHSVYFVSYMQIYLRNLKLISYITNKYTNLIEYKNQDDNQLLILILNNSHYIKILTNKNDPFDKSINKNIYLTQNETYELSEVHFIDLSLVYNNNTYPIALKTNTFNFYIVNNNIDRYFVEYYMKHFLNLSLPIDVSIDYKLDIIDNNANLVELTNKDTITLNKQDYTVN